jgi:pimeloyl-ACP methyl ester carboxylesterase
MSPWETPATPAFYDTEAQVFARYALRPQTRQLRLVEPGMSLRAVEAGSGTGEPLVFLHGICLAAAHWASMVARLGSRRCIAIDMPGHGGSDGADYTGVDLRRWHTRMLAGCLDALGLDSAHIVGHSYGGMIGLWLALDAPKRVRSVVSLGTPSVAFGARPDLTLRMLSKRGIGPLVLTMPNPGFVYRRILAVSLGRGAIGSAPPELIRATYLGTRRRDYARTVSTYLREQFRGAGASPPRYVLQDDELARIRRPVLFVLGNHDDRYQPIGDARRKASRIPGARFELVVGGHEPWLDDLAPCAQVISDFVDDSTSGIGRRGDICDGGMTRADAQDNPADSGAAGDEVVPP